MRMTDEGSNMVEVRPDATEMVLGKSRKPIA
jgi:hypothetical protein